MKSMKWRNAYLLLYERKTPYDVQSEEEDEKEKSTNLTKSNPNEDVQMQPANTLNILPEIEEKIAYENQKYWQNRFLFGQEYGEFVYDISLYWNTQTVIPRQYLTKNDDFHLTGFAKPPEYERDENIPLPADEALPLAKLNSQQQIDDCELSVFKFAAGFYVTILQRAMNKTLIANMLNLLKAYMNKNPNCARWLITEFCSEEILHENLLQCPQKEMRRFLVGLLYCAMLKIYPLEKDQINNYWKLQNPIQGGITVLGNFALILIKNLYEVKKYVAFFAQYF